MNRRQWWDMAGWMAVSALCFGAYGSISGALLAFDAGDGAEVWVNSSCALVEACIAFALTAALGDDG